MSVAEAIGASELLFERGDLAMATRVLDPFAGARTADLQRGAIAAEAVLLEGADPAEVELILTPYLDDGHALDLIGLAHLHSALTTGAHTLAEAVGECTAASRLDFDTLCWNAANTLHIGMSQQALGSHDIAEMYLRDAYQQAGLCPSQRALAAFHLGLDALARTSSDLGTRLIEEALDIRRSHFLDVRVPETLAALAMAVEASDPSRAGELADEAVHLGRALSARRPLAVALGVSGRLRASKAHLDEAMGIAERLGDRSLRKSILRTLESQAD